MLVYTVKSLSHVFFLLEQTASIEHNRRKSETALGPPGHQAVISLVIYQMFSPFGKASTSEKDAAFTGESDATKNQWKPHTL